MEESILRLGIKPAIWLLNHSWVPGWPGFLLPSAGPGTGGHAACICLANVSLSLSPVAQSPHPCLCGKEGDVGISQASPSVMADSVLRALLILVWPHSAKHTRHSASFSILCTCLKSFPYHKLFLCWCPHKLCSNYSSKQGESTLICLVMTSGHLR